MNAPKLATVCRIRFGRNQGSAIRYPEPPVVKLPAIGLNAKYLCRIQLGNANAKVKLGEHPAPQDRSRLCTLICTRCGKYKPIRITP